MIGEARGWFRLAEVFGQYYVGVVDGLVFALCARCSTALAALVDIEGKQAGLTLADVVDQICDHEIERH